MKHEQETKAKPDMLRYQCANCGNTALQAEKPDNTVCGGCDKPDWKLKKIQESYQTGGKN